MTQDPDAQEDSTIPRGEALAGLGLLGLLAAGVVGTIGFRIVSAPPRRPAPHADMIWASQTPPSAVENALVDAVPPAAARGTADADVIPARIELTPSVPVGSISELAPADEHPLPGRDAAPRFVAPGQRPAAGPPQ